MKKWKKSTFALGGVIVCAILAGLGVAEAIIKMSKTTTIVVSTHYLPPFTQIKDSDVITTTVSENSGIKGLVTNKKDVVGHYLTFPIPNGYPVTSSDLSTSDSYSSFLTEWELKAGQQGVMLELKAGSDVLQLVQSGEQIDLIVPDKRNPNAFEQDIVTVLNVLRPDKGGNAVGLMIFVPNSEFTNVAPAVLSGSVQLGLISQSGSYSTPATITALPAGAATGKNTSNSNVMGTQSNNSTTGESGQTTYTDPKTGQTVTLGSQPPGNVAPTGNGGN